jgi:hypothetical protein
MDKGIPAGASTADILVGYASAVDALRVVDPSCVMMYAICDAIKSYLRYLIFAPIIPVIPPE